MQTNWQRDVSDALVIDKKIKSHQGDPKTRRLHLVCMHHCNSGWISKLEESTKEFLVSLIRGESFVLTAEQQRILAFWITIPTVLWEFTQASSQVISPEERLAIYKKREPPPNWRIWIGQYIGKDWNTRYRHHGLRLVDSRTAHTDIVGLIPPNFQTSTLQIGEFFINVMSSGVPEMATIPADTFTPPRMTRIWPPIVREIFWPPIQSIDDPLAMEIADGWVLPRNRPFIS